MSSYIKQQKGVSFNYLQFLWGSIATIRAKQGEGDFGTALKLAYTLIDYLPETLKEEFGDRANAIGINMERISAGDLPEIRKQHDIFLKIVYKHKVLRAYSNRSLMQFVNDLTRKLDKSGYMIARSSIVEGESHTLRDQGE